MAKIMRQDLIKKLSTYAYTKKRVIILRSNAKKMVLKSLKQVFASPLRLKLQEVAREC